MRTDRPFTLRIGYKDFTVSFVDKVDKGKSLGSCQPYAGRTKYKGQIKIAKRLPKREKANTVLHEVMHAIIYAQGVEYTEKEEEQAVTAFTNGLIALMRDNPKFMAEIQRMVK